jgi:hypothetical protein
MEELGFRIAITDPDVVGIVETFACSEINDAELSLPGYNMFRQDRKSGIGGGLLLYVKENLSVNIIENVSDTTFQESLWCYKDKTGTSLSRIML